MTPEECLARFAELESHLVRLERQCDDLNAVILGQGREMTRLRKLCERLAEAVQGPGRPESPADERPPHYLP